MKESYTIASKKDSKELSRYLAKEGQFLLPMLDLIEQAETAVDEVIDVVGRSAIEAILLLSARQVAGDLHKGKAAGGPSAGTAVRPVWFLWRSGSFGLSNPAFGKKAKERAKKLPCQPIRRCRRRDGSVSVFCPC